MRIHQHHDQSFALSYNQSVIGCSVCPFPNVDFLSSYHLYVWVSFA